MSGRAKVVHLTSVHTPWDTRILRKECRTLVEAGYEVVLVGPHGRDEVRHEVRIRAVREPAGRLERVTRTAAAVVRRALEERADLYHFHDPELLPWARLLQLRGERVIFDMHENVPAAIRSRFWIRPALRRLAAGLYRLLERALLPRVPVIFAEDSYREVYPWIREWTTVLNMPRIPDLPAATPRRRDVPTVVYLGVVSSDRGSTMTLAALEILRAEGLDVRWECIGPVSSERDAAELRAAADRLGEDVVRLRGKLLQEEAFPLMAECHVGLAILREVPNYTGSYPTKLFEYMACGLPVIASDFPLYRDVVEGVGCGLCVDPRDPEGIAAGIRRLLDDPEEARAMGERGRRATRTRYSWTGEGEKLLAFYSRLLDTRQKRTRRGAFAGLGG